jgi:hypothetical protein
MEPLVAQRLGLRVDRKTLALQSCEREHINVWLPLKTKTTRWRYGPLLSDHDSFAVGGERLPAFTNVGFARLG